MPLPAPLQRPLRVCVIPVLLAGLCACAAAAPAAGQHSATRPAVQSLPTFDPDRHLRTQDVRVGMKGYGLSVFNGTELERFEVEVTGILSRSHQLDTDIVLIRCFDEYLEHTGPISGMSGSPIYLRCDDGKDRLLGAFAFGWPGSKDTVAGVQPIEQMLQSPRLAAGGAVNRNAAPEQEAAADAARSIDLRDAARLMTHFDLEAVADLLSQGIHPASRAADSLQALGVPLGASGLSSAAGAELEPLLSLLGLGPLLPMALEARPLGPAQPDPEASKAPPIRPGDALIVPIVTGDMQLLATGTATEVIGDHVYGFGHPLLGGGDIEVPMASGRVEAVIATDALSFKIGAAGDIIGTLTSDTTAGISGVLGAAPSTIPVAVTLKRGEAEQKYRFAVIRHPMLTSVGMVSVMQSVLDFAGSGQPYGAARWRVKMELGGLPPLELAGVSSNADPFAGSAIGAIVMPLITLEGNPFAEVKVQSVEVTIEELTATELPSAVLVGVSAPRTRVRAGEEVQVNLRLNPMRGAAQWKEIRFAIPQDLPPGAYSLQIMDATSAQMMDMATRPFAFEADSVQSLIEGLMKASDYPANAVYLRMTLSEEVPRLAVGRTPMPNLPPSRAALLRASGRSEVAEFVPTVAASRPLPFILGMSEAVVEITVEP